MKAIIRNITTINRTIGASTSRIKYIVVHYVGAVSTAVNNGSYFKSVYRGVSAHYFTDEFGIVQVVEDKDIAWHCGATQFKHPYARNSNAIGVEMCCKKGSNGNWYFEPETVKNTQELVAVLMKKYNVPKSNVIRHFDVTGKNCPEPYVRNTSSWNGFLSGLGAPVAPPANKVPYVIKVVGLPLNVRSGPSTTYPVGSVIRQGSTYTIIEEKNGWGRLKSGAGWIILKETIKE